MTLAEFVVFDSESYGVVVESLLPEGDLQHVFVMLMQMMERGIAPNHDAWNLLIRVAMEGNLRIDCLKG